MSPHAAIVALDTSVAMFMAFCKWVNTCLTLGSIVYIWRGGGHACVVVHPLLLICKTTVTVIYSFFFFRVYYLLIPWEY